jgi:hypothetical protein
MKPICRPEGALATRVCDLLNQAGLWDDGALSKNFVPFDTAAIRRIPLGRFDEDFWAWTGKSMDYIQYDQLTESWQLMHIMRKTTPRTELSTLVQITVGFGKNYGKLMFHQR